MAKKRAVSKKDKELQPANLPILYSTLVPLLADRHGQLGLSEERDYSFATKANAIPLFADEFSQAMRDYPIVFAENEIPTPLALVGFRAGTNDFVDKKGNWKKGTYIPAYLRRHPFAYLRESQDSTRNILCADLSSPLFINTPDDDRKLFNEDGSTAVILKNVMDFCNRYETSAKRTELLMTELSKLGLISPSTVSVNRNGKTIKIEGFSIFSEDKFRELDDKTLASLARRGITSVIAAHQMSMTNFSDFEG